MGDSICDIQTSDLGPIFRKIIVHIQQSIQNQFYTITKEENKVILAVEGSLTALQCSILKRL